VTKKRDYSKEYETYHAKPEQVANRSSRNKARRKLVAAGVDVAGKDVDHKDGQPRNNSRKNLQAISKSVNRSKH
jgi:hypothetical protein